MPSGITGTASGGISGPGYVVLQGGGNLTLSGASTYTGVTTINAGSSLMLTNAANTLTANITINSAAKLQLDNAATLNSGGTYSYYITDNGSLVWNSSANQILAQVISGSGSLTLNNSSSTLTLKAANTYTGATTVTAGNLYIGDGTSTTPTIACASGSSSSIAVAVGGVVRWNNVPNTTSVASFYNTITGAGKLQFEGTNSAYSSYSSYYLYGDMSGFSGSVDLDQSLISIQSQPTSSAIFNVGQNSTLRLASTSFNPFTINIKDGASWFYNGLPSAVGAIEIGTTTVTFPGNIVLNQSSSSSFQGGNSTIGTGFSSPPTITLSGVISGSGWFYQDQDYYSAGNSPYSYVILTGQNTFTGNIRIGLYNSGSILSIAGSGTLGLGNYAGNIFSVGTFKYLSTADQTLSGVISGSGSILKDTGTGILTLTGNNTYSGTTSCYAGKISIKGAGNVLNAGIVIGPSAKVQVDNAGVLNSSSTFSSTITTNGDFYWNSSADQVLSGVISGTGNLTMNGSGKLTLTANDSYSGATTVNAGTIYVQGASSNGGLMYSTPVTIATGAKLELSNSYYSLLQSGASSPVLNVNGTLQIDGNYHVWYPTTTTLNNGTILVPSSGVVSYGSICIGAARTITGTGNSYIIGTGTNGAGTYGIGFNGGNGPLTFNVPSASDVLTVGCDIANGTFAGYIAKTGTGTLILKGNNSYGGSTTVSAGTVKCGSASALGGSSAIINDGTIDLNGYSETIGYLEESTGVATGKITNTTSTPVTLTIAQIASNTSYPYNGIIEDGSAKTSLAISNAYATYLTGANTYTGTTTVASGSTLSIGNGGTTGSISDGASGTAITNLGTLQYYNTTGDTWANTLTGTGTFSIAAGTLTLTGTANTLTTGTIGISTGATLQTDGAGVLNTSVTGYTGTINDSGLLVWKSSQAAKLSGVISGIGGLTLNNSSTTLTLMGADTYTGATTVTAGNLYIGDGTSTTPVISGSSAVSIASGATMRLWNNYSTGTSKTIANTITGAGTLEFYGNASASNAYSQYYISGNISGFTGTVNLYESMYQGAASYSFPASSATINIKSYGSLYNNNSGATIPSTINIQDGAGWPVSTSSLGAIVANASVTNISGNVVLNQTTAMSNGYNGTVGTNSTNYQINFSGVISGSGWFKQDQYTLGTTVYSRVALTGQNTFTGPIAIGMVSSVFQLSGTGNLGSGNYAGNIANTGTFEYSSTGGQTLSGVISGTGVLTKDTGTGTLTLTGNNTYTGATTCNAGTISIQGSANVLTGNMTIGTSGTVQVDNAGVLNSSGTYSGTIADAGAFNWNSSVGSILSGVISGAGSFTKNGSGTVTLAANETYTGATNVNSGILLVKGSSGNGGLAYSTPVTIATSATLELDGTYPNQLQSSISGVLNVNGTLKIDGNNYDQWNMTTTSLNNGTISLPAIGNATYGTIYIIAAKTFTATGNSSITGGTYGIYLNGANLTTAVTNSSDNLTISCNIVGNANGITKTGSGVLYLNGTNGYMGATTISAGSVGGTGSSTSSAHTVATGAAIFGGLGVGSAGTYSPGALTFSAAASLLQVNTDGGSGVSVVDCGAKTITATSGFTVNITGALNVGTYYILKSTGTLPSVVPTVGTNSTGHTVTFSWVAGTGLKMVVS